MLLFDEEKEFVPVPSKSRRCSKWFCRACKRRARAWLKEHHSVQDILRSFLWLKEILEIVCGIVKGSQVVAGAVAGVAAVSAAEAP